MYRTQFFLKIGGNVLFIYIQICIWRSLLGAGSGMAAQVGVQYMSSYVIVANILSQVSRTAFTRVFAEVECGTAAALLDFGVLRPGTICVVNVKKRSCD